MFPSQKCVENAEFQSALLNDASGLLPLNASNAYRERLEVAKATDSLFEDTFTSQWEKLAQQAQQLWKD